MSSQASPELKRLLTRCRQLANDGSFDVLLEMFSDISRRAAADPHGLLHYCDILMAHGFLLEAERVLLEYKAVAHTEWRSALGQASIYSQRAQHSRARTSYERLCAAVPENLVVQRGRLMAMEYDPKASEQQRLNAASAMGALVTKQAGGPHTRPVSARKKGAKLRIGYVTADMCHHPVGLFLRGVIANHQRARPFLYSSGGVSDWVTNGARRHSEYRDVSSLNDKELVHQIQTDAIDVLVDLSGYTGGSRLSAFAYRPAPVMVSWLGYCGTTGLEFMDGVLMDRWHTPASLEGAFIEPVIRLDHGRLCYQPVPFAPDVSAAPHSDNGFVTFGSFNNTAKLNPTVIKLWSRILAGVSDSRLVLKWRTFNDGGLREQMHRDFASYGIAPSRVELRSHSSHQETLAEYADIDIALDPFPFSGGLTTCEALWMGVPVVTMPGDRAVSRQGLAILNQVGLSELVATNPDNYVEIATNLANSSCHIGRYRTSLRDKLLKSQLCDVVSFTETLEARLEELAATVRRLESYG